MDEVTDVETPRSWIWWSLLSAISAAAGTNYYLKAINGKIIYKPNLYVMLLGESGLGKGFGINLAKLLVQKADTTRVIAGRSSIQAIVTELSRQKTRADGKAPILDSRGFIVNGELSSAIIADVDSLAILTDLYDGQYNPEWTNLLKLSGAEKLKDPYITALFGSSLAHFYDTIPQANIEGGYMGRNLVIYEEKRSQDIDLLDDNEDEVDKMKDYLIPKYAEHLVLLSKSKGRLIPGTQAKTLFNDWRRGWRKTQPADKTGFANRVPDHVLKVSMLLSLSRYNSAGFINELDVEEAIEKVTSLVYASKMTTDGTGLDPLAAQTKMVINILLRSPNNEMKRKNLLTSGHGNFDTSTLDKICTSLIDMGWLERSKVQNGSHLEWMFKLSGEPLEKYKQFLSSKGKERNETNS